MLLGELLTLRQQHLPVKVVVFNNGALGFVELEMKAAGIATYATELDNPDFAGIAKSAGLFGATVNKADELEETLGAAFGHDGPALVDVRTARQELTLPPKLTSARSRASPCTRPGRYCPAAEKNSSSSRRRTCANWRPNDLSRPGLARLLRPGPDPGQDRLLPRRSDPVGPNRGPGLDAGPQTTTPTTDDGEVLGDGEAGPGGPERGPAGRGAVRAVGRARPPAVSARCWA